MKAMNKRSILLLALFPLLQAVLSAEPIRILRIGDSITWQQSGDATLPDLLANEGIACQFVGTQNWFDDGGYVPVELAREEDQFSEGYPGMTVEWFTDPNFSWASWQARPTTIPKGDGNTPIRHALTNGNPDIILLMIGTNNTARDKDGVRGEDSSGEVNVAFLSQKYSALLDEIDALAPDAKVIVAELIDVIDTGTGNNANRSARTLHFNEKVVRPVVQARIAAGKPYTLVNFFTLLEVPFDYMDSVHPNINGIALLGNAWFEAIVAALQPADAYAEWAANNNILGGPADLIGGVANLVRYALGGNADTPAGELRTQLQAQTEGGSTTLRIAFNRIDDPMVRYAIWQSSDLADWGEAPVWQGTGAHNGVPGPFQLELPASGPQSFLRLAIDRD